MDGSGRRSAWRRRTLLLRWCCGLLLLLLPAAFPSAGAAFRASTSDTANSVSSGSLAPPTGLTASQTCAADTISMVGATSATGSFNDKLVIPVPAGVATGDILFAQVTNRYDSSASLSTSWAAGSWTAIGSRTTAGAGANSITSVMGWHRVAAGDPTTVTFTLGTGTGSTYLAGGIAAFRGVLGTGSPIDASATTTGTGAAATLPSVTTTTAKTMLVFATSKQEDTLLQVGSSGGLWRLTSAAATETQSASAGYELFAGSGATGARTAAPVSGSAGMPWVAHTAALKPALIPSASLTWTASTSTTATGYTLQRYIGASLDASASVTPRTATAVTNGPLVNGTSYTFSLTTTQGSWTSTAATTTLTPSC